MYNYLVIKLTLLYIQISNAFFQNSSKKNLKKTNKIEIQLCKNFGFMVQSGTLLRKNRVMWARSSFYDVKITTKRKKWIGKQSAIANFIMDNFSSIRLGDRYYQQIPIVLCSRCPEISRAKFVSSVYSSFSYKQK